MTKEQQRMKQQGIKKGKGKESENKGEEKRAHSYGKTKTSQREP